APRFESALQTGGEIFEKRAGLDLDFVLGVRLRDVDVDGGVRVDGMELDLLVGGGGGGLGFFLFGEFGAAGADA
ncbi:MAG: hypothetical protein Q9190_007781, partial [Brigantiaea leucoxantha]